MTLVGIRGGDSTARATLTSSLIGELRARDLRVSVVADAGPAAEIDIPGKDSYEHRRAGAREVLAVSRLRWALVHEAKETEAGAQTVLDALLARLTPCDIVLAPGFVKDAVVTLELAPEGNLRATRAAGPSAAYHLDSTGQIADFIHDALTGKPSTP
jgi:molybdopterin-guanine dinucleotide biosynthesis protein B